MTYPDSHKKLHQKAKELLQNRANHSEQDYISQLETLILQQTEQLEKYSKELAKSTLGQEIVKTSYKRLKRLEAKYRYFFNSAPIGIFHSSLENDQFIEANQFLANMLGYSSVRSFFSAINGAGISKAFYKSPKERQLIIKKLLHHEGWQIIESTYKHRDGSTVVGRTTIRLLKNEDGSHRIEGFLEDITGSRETVKQLQISERKFFKTFHTNPNMMLITSLKDDVVVDVNRTFIQALGYRRDDLLNKRIPNLSVFPDIQQYRKSRTMLLIQGSLKNFEINIKRRQADVRICELFAEIITIPPNAYMLWTITDITDRKRNELKIQEQYLKLKQQNEEIQTVNEELQATNDELAETNDKMREITQQLRDSEAQFRTMSENAPVAIFVNSPDGNTVFVNREYREITGLTIEDIKSELSWLDIVDADYRDSLWRAWQQLLERKTSSFELIIKIKHAKDDKNYWLSLKMTSIYSEGELINFMGLMENITQRLESERELRYSREFLSDLLNQLPQPVFVKDTDFRWIILNDAFARFMGYDKQMLLGKTDYDFFPKEEADVFRQKDMEVFESGLSNRNEEYVSDARGNRHTVISYKTILTNPHGKKVLLGIIQNITKQKNIEQILLKAMRTADEANRAKSEFLANMSHEIRTPMNAILGFSEILQEKLGDQEQYKDYLNGISSSGRSLLGLINDILDLSKIEARSLEIEESPINISALLEEVGQVFAIKCREKGLTISIDQSDVQTPNIMFDEIRLRQVLFNLIANAVKFTHEGYVKLTAASISRPEEDYTDLQFVVEDTGIGIPKNEQQKIFEAFRQREGQSTRKYGGTGLGLTITKRLVDLMNGKITLESKEGKGSRFTVDFYHVAISSLNKLPEQPHALETFSSLKFMPSRILLVEDQESNRNIIRMFLDDQPIELDEFASGQEALDYLAAGNHPDLILMDIQLTGMSGFLTTQHIRNNEDWKDIPVVMVSALLINDAQRAKNLFDDYLHKPITKQVLTNSLKKFLAVQPENVSGELIVSHPFLEALQQIASVQDFSPTLRQQLRNDLLPAFHTIREVMAISDIKTFARQVLVLGQKENVKPLCDYGQELLALADNFQINKIMKTLPLFQDIANIICEAD